MRIPTLRTKIGTENELEQEGGEPEVTTDKAFEDGISELNGMDNGIDNVYVEVPKVNLDKIIITNKRVHEEIDSSWQLQSTPMKCTCEYTGRVTEHKADFSKADMEYQKFKKSAQREVNYLVKEFECKKSADICSVSLCPRLVFLTVLNSIPTSTTKTCSVRSVFFLTDRITVLSSFLIGLVRWEPVSWTPSNNCSIWCGSVTSVISPLMSMLSPTLTSGTVRMKAVENESMDWEINKLFVHKDFNLLNLLTGDVKRKELEKQMLSIWRIVYNICHWTDYEIPNGYGLSGTPLNETLVSLHQIIPQFQKNHDLQKVQCVILTDGEANHLPYCKTLDLYEQW